MLDSARKISSSIQNISAITEESAAGTQEVSASMNEQITSVQEVVEETETMQQMVTKLQKKRSRSSSSNLILFIAPLWQRYGAYMLLNIYIPTKGGFSGGSHLFHFARKSGA